MKVAGLLALLLLAACADPARNLYEGIRSNNEAKRTPAERAVQPSPDYDSYRRAVEGDDAKK